jgi:hypothetical protein
LLRTFGEEAETLGSAVEKDPGEQKSSQQHGPGKNGSPRSPTSLDLGRSTKTQAGGAQKAHFVFRNAFAAEGTAAGGAAAGSFASFVIPAALL